MIQSRLLVLETHPVQYHAPVYRAVQRLGVPVTVVYGSDFSVAGYRDHEFGSHFAWDTDLLSGYSARFLTQVATGGAADYSRVRANGLARVLAEINPSAVLSLGYGSRFDRAALLLVMASGRPLLFRGETTDHARQRSWLKRQLRDGLLGRLYRRCRRLLYVGSRSHEHYRRLGCAEDRLVFSPYCVDTTPFRPSEEDREEFREATRRDLRLPPEAIVILFSGKLVARKGVDLLPPAAEQLSVMLRRPVALLLLGDGQLRAEMEQQSAAVTIRCLGFQNQTRLSPYYHAADLLVLPSRESETWGLVVNEALHHGLPCVVSDLVGCAPDLVLPGATGEVCRAVDVPKLASGLARAMSLVGRPDVRMRCREHTALYSVDAAAAGIVTAFESVLRDPCGVA